MSEWTWAASGETCHLWLGRFGARGLVNDGQGWRKQSPHNQLLKFHLKFEADLRCCPPFTERQRYRHLQFLQSDPLRLDEIAGRVGSDSKAAQSTQAREVLATMPSALCMQYRLVEQAVAIGERRQGTGEERSRPRAERGEATADRQTIGRSRFWGAVLLRSIAVM